MIGRDTHSAFALLSEGFGLCLAFRTVSALHTAEAIYDFRCSGVYGAEPWVLTHLHGVLQDVTYTSDRHSAPLPENNVKHRCTHPN